MINTQISRIAISTITIKTTISINSKILSDINRSLAFEHRQVLHDLV